MASYPLALAESSIPSSAPAMRRQAPEGLLGIHVNMPATVPPEIARALQAGEPAPAGLSEREKVAYEGMANLYTKGSGYAIEMVTRPQTIGYSLADSPIGEEACSLPPL